MYTIMPSIQNWITTDWHDLNTLIQRQINSKVDLAQVAQLTLYAYLMSDFNLHIISEWIASSINLLQFHALNQ